MTDKYQSIELARQLVTETNMSADLILQKCGVTHREYRKYYPETPISPALAWDIIEAQKKLSNKQIQAKWNLTTSQLHYALYNNNATTPPPEYATSPRAQVTESLKLANGSRSQTDIAEEHGVSQSFVHKVAKELNLLPNNRKKRVMLTAEQWHEIEVKSHSTPIERLAKQYGVSRDTIYKGLRS